MKDDTTAGDVCMGRVDVVGGGIVVVNIVVVAIVVVVVVNFGTVGSGVVKWEAPKSVILTKTHRFSCDPPILYIPLKINKELLYCLTGNIQLLFCRR